MDATQYAGRKDVRGGGGEGQPRGLSIVLLYALIRSFIEAPGWEFTYFRQTTAVQFDFLDIKPQLISDLAVRAQRPENIQSLL